MSETLRMGFGRMAGLVVASAACATLLYFGVTDAYRILATPKPVPAQPACEPTQRSTNGTIIPDKDFAECLRNRKKPALERN